jgi:subtilisin family serine protease
MTSAHHKLIAFLTALTMVLAIDALAMAGTAFAGVSRDAGVSCASTQQGLRSVVVVADSGRTAAVAADVRAAGGRVCDRFGRLLDARVPVGAVRAFGSAADVTAVRPAGRPYALGLDEGVGVTNATAWQARGLRGSGVAVAVIDLGFGGLREAQAAGLVPASAVNVDYCPQAGFFGNPHGTAVAEVVAAEAPGVQLYLICVLDVVDLARAEAYVAEKGIPIVNHSVGWFNMGPGDGTGGPGTPDRVVADARAHGILWVNAAGNEAQRHWRGRFVDANSNGYLDFVPGDDGNLLDVPTGGGFCAFLRWYEWPNPSHDYELQLIDQATGLVLATGYQEGSSPMRTACWGNGRIWQSDAVVVEIVIRAPGGAGTAPLELFVPGAGELSHYVEAGSIADPGSSPNVFAVGAICWQTGELERFSSRGPTIDGRMKPDLVAPDSVSSGTYGAFSKCGVSGFAGTSAAAPHVAGAAALIKQRFPSYTLAQIQAYLVRHATDLGQPGPDNLFGAGALLMPAITGPVRPSVRAVAARGTFGHPVRLSFELGASPHEVRTSVEVFQGSRIVASSVQGFQVVDEPMTANATWRSPARPPLGAAYRFCVTAQDAAGGTSEPSCAAIRLLRG